ncbi:MAG: hypothetical protein ACR2FS_12320 [Phormidesmis sp.]
MAYVFVGMGGLAGGSAKPHVDAEAPWSPGMNIRIGSPVEFGKKAKTQYPSATHKDDVQIGVAKGYI